jgi:hypothetical protein
MIGQGPVGSVQRFKRNGTKTERQRNGKILLSLSLLMTHRIEMPIRAENRWLYPIDWPQLSGTIRFERAGRRCEQCRRPHLRRVAHLGDGRWWDAEATCWRSSQGKRIKIKGGFALASIRVTYVVLACAHLDHDPGNSSRTNLKALCQRCHMIHDATEHRWQRWWNVFRVRALRDLYEDPRVTRHRNAIRQEHTRRF